MSIVSPPPASPPALTKWQRFAKVVREESLRTAISAVIEYLLKQLCGFIQGLNTEPSVNSAKGLSYEAIAQASTKAKEYITIVIFTVTVFVLPAIVGASIIVNNQINEDIKPPTTTSPVTPNEIKETPTPTPTKTLTPSEIEEPRMKEAAEKYLTALVNQDVNMLMEIDATGILKEPAANVELLYTEVVPTDIKYEVISADFSNKTVTFTYSMDGKSEERKLSLVEQDNEWKVNLGLPFLHDLGAQKIIINGIELTIVKERNTDIYMWPGVSYDVYTVTTGEEGNGVQHIISGTGTDKAILKSGIYKNLTNIS